MRLMIGIGLVISATILSVHAEQQVASPLPVLDTQIGDATLYAARFEGRKTASGIIFEGSKAMAAHRTYPFGTVVRVTYLRNGRSVTVVIVDRGPYGKNWREGAIIDLSPVAAERLDMLRVGQARVKLEVLAWGKGEYLN
jgi:rare lipoprotein A